MPNSSREKYVRAAPLEVEALAIQKKINRTRSLYGGSGRQIATVLVALCSTSILQPIK